MVIKRCLLLGRKAMTKLHSVLKSRDITWLTKVCKVKAMILLVVMYGCESWTIKKVKQWRNGVFELPYWRRLLKVPRTARTNQSILKEINPEYSWKNWCWSWSSNTLATWCEELTHWKRPCCWKDWRQEEKGMTEDEMVGWHHWLKGHELEQTAEGGKGQGSLACCSQWSHKKLDAIGQLNNNGYCRKLYQYSLLLDIVVD